MYSFLWITKERFVKLSPLKMSLFFNPCLFFVRSFLSSPLYSRVIAGTTADYNALVENLDTSASSSVEMFNGRFHFTLMNKFADTIYVDTHRHFTCTKINCARK